MYLTLTADLDANSNFSNIQVKAPYSHNESATVLYFNRLPVNLSKTDLIKYIENNDFDFLTHVEGNFIIVAITQIDQQQEAVVFCDRYRSQRIMFKEQDSRLIISNNPGEIRSTAKLSSAGIRFALNSRILANEDFDKDIKLLPRFTGIKLSNTGLTLFRTITNKLAIKRQPNFNNDESVIDAIQNSIEASLANLAPEAPLAVLLSGGVDSFILAAIASKRFKSVVAYTPTWDNAKNPELERAIRFAKHLNIKHEIMQFGVEDFLSGYEELLSLNGVPIRNYSSVVLHQLLKQIPEEYILYGEYADTFFGSTQIKYGVIDAKYAQFLKLIPGVLLPNSIKHTASTIKNFTLNDTIQIRDISKTWAESVIQQLLKDDYSPPMSAEQSHDVTIEKAMEHVLDTDCCQHMLEIETSALAANKSIITPFLNERMIAISNGLTEQQMFGPTGTSLWRNFRKDTSSDVKDLLKQLACRFIEKDAIYLKKLGFPTPFPKWIGAINKEEYVARFDFDYLNAEEQWSLINVLWLISKP